MKALSIKQPWASLIAHGIKDIENRTWRTHFRGKIYIHASGVPSGRITQLLTELQLDVCFEETDFRFLDTTLIKSAIIGEVDIIDCIINHESIWAEKTEIQKCNNCPSEIDGFDICCNYKGKKEGFVPYIGKPIYNWVLANAKLYEKPILNVKGKLSFWDFEPINL